MTDVIKVGLLGAGYILDSHAQALHKVPAVVIHAVCDVSRGRAVAAARRYDIAHVFSSIEQLAASDCDAVHVLLPPALHIAAAHVLLQAGKSVFLEKPMGLNSEGCLALCDLAEHKGVALGVNHNFLFAPNYESLRNSIKAGDLGRIDHLSVNWHFGLSFLQFGPFDNWMLASPANIFFETGPHLAAFVIDLLGLPEIITSVAANPIALPGDQTVYRQWTAVGRLNAAAVLLSISMTPGHADRFLRVRGRGASAQLDFGRDIVWRDLTETDNPIFDSFSIAETAGRSLRRSAGRDRTRRLKAALSRHPSANPFEETIFRSISAFYATQLKSVDSRHNGRFAVDVIRLCERVTKGAGFGAPSQNGVSVTMPAAAVAPTVLVVGGTGFIGRRLVKALIQKGVGVRVLTRNPRAAAVELGDLPVELFAGSHGNPENAKSALAGIRVVYHLAKCEGKKWQDYIDGDIGPTKVLAEASLAAGVERFIYTGTIASYDSADARGLINNLTPVDPAISRRSHYARSKAACESLLQSMQEASGLPLVIARPGIVIGPGTPPAHLGVGRFSSETRVDFFGDGSNRLPLVLVDDVADALVRAMDAPGIIGQSLLLTSPPLMSAKEYVNEVALCMNVRIDARPRAAWRYWSADLVKELAKNVVRHPNRRWPSLHDSRCQAHRATYDSSLTEVALGWHPVADRETMIERGIREAVAWFTR